MKLEKVRESTKKASEALLWGLILGVGCFAFAFFTTWTAAVLAKHLIDAVRGIVLGFSCNIVPVRDALWTALAYGVVGFLAGLIAFFLEQPKNLT